MGQLPYSRAWFSLVTAGREAEGLALIDEAMAGTLGGERSRLDTVVFTCCDMLVACDLAADLQRATQWCQVADQFINRYGCPFLYARCRTLYGSVLLAKGRWADAERELLAAVRMAEGPGPGPHAEALARLAELRLRQGRLEEAEGLLPERGGGRAAARTAARIRLARGEPSVAAGLLERALRDGGEPHIHGEQHLRAAAALETLVTARLALGDPDAAAAAVDAIAGLAGGDDGGQVAALAALASAHLATAGGRLEEARGELSGRWGCSCAWTCRTRWRWSGWSWPGSWPPPTPRWPSPRPGTPSPPSSGWGRPATPTRPTPCSAPWGWPAGPGPSGSGS
jgi:tetratricopeptide (TPR) repeat protein